MPKTTFVGVGWGTLTLTLAFGGPPGVLHAQERDRAVLVVEGVVQEVFRGTRSNRDGLLVQIEVTRSELGPARRESSRLLIPAPGDSLYVHAIGNVPEGQGPIRAYLAPHPGGGWEAASTDWFEPTSNRTAPHVPTPRPTGPEPDGRVSIASLGLTGQGRTADGRYAVKVTSVERGGPAMKAGLEVGDMIVGVNEKELTNAGQLDDLARRGGPLNLILIDINTNKLVRVGLELPRTSGGPAEPAPTPPPSNPKASLGISAEPIRIGPRTALKVIRVEPGSPAQRSGIEPGDVIVEANGIPVTGAEPLGAALRKGGSSLNLVIRDVRTGRDTPVSVNLSQPETTDATPSPNPNPRPRPTPTPSRDRETPTTEDQRGLGAVTELVFLDNDAAVKISEVTPGGPAQRAGLKPGDIIIEANGTPILHPNTLNEELRKGNPSVRLIVVDGRSGRKSTVEVNLGGR
ncbi:MAG: PDZ domain-containing protein [Isosphaeraceae bacterium]